MNTYIALATFAGLSGGTIIGFILSGVFASGNRADHARCGDALATLRARVDRALAAETPGAAPAAKRLCRILRGEE